MGSVTDRPITDFIDQMHDFHAHDFAVLFYLVSVQERGWPISPAAKDGRWSFLTGITRGEYQSAFTRLLKCKEVVEVKDDHWRGYEVARFEQLQDGMMDFGKRRYFREAARKSREKKMGVPA